MTSGGSRRRECPLPQKVASLRPRASGLLGFAQKLRVLFGGPSLHSSVRLRRTRHSGQKSRRGRRPERCAAPVQPCLSLPEPPPPGGKGVPPFPALVPGAGTLPVGFQGRSALVAPKGAKSPMRTGARRIIHSERLEPSSEAVLSTRARSGRPTPFDRRNGRLWPAGRRPLRSSGRDIPEFFRYALSGLPSVR